MHSKVCLEYSQLNIYDYLIGLRATYKNEVKITSCRLTSQKNKRIFCAQNSIDGKRNNVVPRKKVNVLIWREEKKGLREDKKMRYFTANAFVSLQREKYNYRRRGNSHQ